MQIFFSGGDPEAPRPLFSDDFRFSGPLYRYDSADACIRALKTNPSVDCDYEIIHAYAEEDSACLIYRFMKPGITTPMAQVFEVKQGQIGKI